MSLRRRESGLEELLLRSIVGQAVATTNTVKNFTSDVSYQEAKTKEKHTRSHRSRRTQWFHEIQEWQISCKLWWRSRGEPMSLLILDSEIGFDLSGVI